MALVAFVAVLGALATLTARLWRRMAAPIWAGLLAMVPVGLGAYCVLRMVEALGSAHGVPNSLPTLEQERLVALHMAQMMRWGLRFAAAALVWTMWLIFGAMRWQPPSRDTSPPPRTRE